MLTTLLAVLMLAQTPAADSFRREAAPLQQAVDAVAAPPVVGRLWQPSKATYLEGYGVIVTLEVSLETPRSPFSTPVSASELRATIAKRQKDLSDRLAVLVRQRVATMASLAPTETLAVIVRIQNFNVADVPDLPGQIVISAKKQSPDQVALKEF